MKIKKSKQNEGWTFIETLIVMAIVLILTAAVGFSAIKQIDKAKRDQILGCISGRDNSLLRLDFFKINRGLNDE